MDSNYDCGGKPGQPHWTEEPKPGMTTLGFNRKAPWRCIKPHCPLECDGCNHAIRNEPGARLLVCELLDAFAKDDLDSPFEDGDSAIVDTARAFLRIPEPARAASDTGEALERSELLATFTDWARQVAARSDVPMGIRNAAARLHDDGKRLTARSLSAGGEA